MAVIKIVGGHGRVGLKIASELAKQPGNIVIALFRNAGDWEEVAATGAVPELLDLSQATVGGLVKAFKGADVIVWTAGNGGRGGFESTYDIDRNAAVRSMQAARQLGGVSRFIMISYLGSPQAPALSPHHPLYHYGQAKHQADEYLKHYSGLNYTIVSPGPLNNNEGTGMIEVVADKSRVGGRSISRHNVALIVSAIIMNPEVRRSTLGADIECLDGDVPVLEALST